MSLLESALGYVSRGWSVFPLSPGSKVPLAGSHGHNDASSDPMQVMSWWTKTPDANIGIACEPSNLLVIDIDPRNGGEEWADLSLLNGMAVEARTGGGGMHYYFQLPEFPHVKSLAPGVDVKGYGGYVVAPPSIVEQGSYTWAATGEPGVLPEWLQTRCKAILRPPVQKVLDGTDDRPGTLYNASASWEEILEPHGWVKVRTGSEGETYWTRPGKRQGLSAVAGGAETDTFWCWSSSVLDIESGVSYNKFGLYATLNHGGDYSAAAKAISKEFTSGGVRVTGSYSEAVGAANGSAYPADQLYDQDDDNDGQEAAADTPSLVGLYCAYAERQTDASRDYHEAVILGLLAALVGDTRADLSVGPLPLNLYLVLVGPSTTSRKSTSQKIGKELIERVLPDTVMADRMTGEGGIYGLAARNFRSSLWMPDELGVTLTQIYTRDFMRPLEELFLTLYGENKYVYQRASGTTVVNGVRLSIVGAATPESLSGAGAGATLGGLLPRFATVFPGGNRVAAPLRGNSNLADEHAELIRRLNAVLGFTQAGGYSQQLVKFTSEALEVLAETERTLRENINAVRLPIMAYKVAALAALSDLRLEATESDAKYADYVVKKWAAGADKLDPYLRRKGSDLEFERKLESVMSYLRMHGGTALRVHISRELRLEPQTAKRLRDCAVEWGLINVNIESPETWSLTSPSN